MALIAVTGGAGFVGSNLVRRLTKHGHEVKVIDDLSTGLESNIRDLDIEFHRVSITDQVQLRSCLKGADFVFHLAARGSVPRSLKNPTATIHTNVIGTQNVLECAREFNSHVIFSGSSSVYGSNLELPKTEKMWTSPISPYAASKLAGEALVESYAKSFGIKVTNFRFFNIYGPYQRPDHDYAAVIPKWIWRAMKNQPLVLFGDGNQTRDFTYVDTVIDILEGVLSANLGHEDPINLAFGNRISLNSVVSLLKEHFPNLVVERQASRKGDVLDSQSDGVYVRQNFPEVVPVPFEVGLKKTINWFFEEGWEVINSPQIID